MTESGALAEFAGLDSLIDHKARLAYANLAELSETRFRFDECSAAGCGMVLDYSRQRVDRRCMDALLDVARERQLPAWRDRLFAGEPVNNSENRPALHMALRGGCDPLLEVEGHLLADQVSAELDKMQGFVEAVHDGTLSGTRGTRIRHVVNVGIGGSDLGVAMAWHALRADHHADLQCHFVSAVDGLQLADLTRTLDPSETLIVVVSKTFSTQETMANAESARQWVCEHLGESAVEDHFAAVSTNHVAMDKFGIHPARRFSIWDWVGGRYSLWSAVGLTLALGVGMKNFRRLLAGARSMDIHFATKPLEENLPVLAAMLDIWNFNILAAHSLVILPYSERLALLPAHLQQLSMESLGKRVTRDDVRVAYRTGPVVWGGSGSNAQHAFMQLLHQGTESLVAEFLLPNRIPGVSDHHVKLNRANALAQADALVQGRTVANQPCRDQPGGQPSSMIGFDSITPELLGSLIAFYEHRVFCCAAVWNINPFDQWGVELGKQIATEKLSGESDIDPLKQHVDQCVTDEQA